jgi:prophage regulatory protein
VKFVRTKDVVRMLGVSRTTLWRMVQAGAFPSPVAISKRATGHVLEEVEAWMAERLQASALGVDSASAPAATDRGPIGAGPRATLRVAHVSTSAKAGLRRRRARG